MAQPGGDGKDGDAIDWIAQAREVAPVVEAAADRIEATRRIPDDVMDALHGAQLYRMALPASLGGGEATPLEIMEVLEIIAGADASTAWCLGQAMGCTTGAAYLEPDVAREVYGAPDAVLAWGPPSASARGIPCEGGWRVTGTWNFASGSPNCTWLGGHCPQSNPDGSPMRDESGRPVIRTFLFPKSSVTMTDVWHVIGLRGTGTDSYAVDDLFVPDGFTLVRDKASERHETGPLYRIPLLTFYGMAFAGVALGLGRRMLEQFKDLAGAKNTYRTTTRLRENAVIQADVAKAEAKLCSARAFLVEMIEDTWASACAGEPFPMEQRARLRIACTWAMNQAREVSDDAYQAAGTTAVFQSSVFERRFRDMRTVSQQGQAHTSNYEGAGQALLGLDPVGARF